jgi:hypothetical protein
MQNRGTLVFEHCSNIPGCTCIQRIHTHTHTHTHTIARHIAFDRKGVLQDIDAKRLARHSEL